LSRYPGRRCCRIKHARTGIEDDNRVPPRRPERRPHAIVLPVSQTAARRADSEPESHIRDDPLWYKDAIVYQLHGRSFMDSSGDGIGDFRGLVEKLDYLQDLGVTALWLLPFYPSPLRDDGYDIADWTDVNPAYGTKRDFQLFLREAHRRNLHVITE